MVEEWCPIHLAGQALGLTSTLLRPHPLLWPFRGEERKLLTGVRVDRGRLEGDGGRPPPSRPIPGLCLPLWVLLSSHLMGSQDVGDSEHPARQGCSCPSSEDQGTRRRPGTRRGSRVVWGLSWLRGSGSMCLSAAQAKGPGLRDPQLLWALEPQDRPGGTGPGPKGWMQGPWDFPPGGTAGSLGAHPVVPTAADLQLFRAAVSANKPHSTAEHFINEQTLHLRGLRSRGSEAASSLTSSHSTSQGA